MDACRLGYADATLRRGGGAVLITLVPDPERALDELARVLQAGRRDRARQPLRPGGRPPRAPGGGDRTVLLADRLELGLQGRPR